MARPQFAQRLSQLRRAMAQQQLDAMLVFQLDNLRYLFNYSGEAAYGIVTQEQTYLITDYRFVAHAHEDFAPYEIQTELVCRDRDRQSLGQAIDAILRQESVQRFAYESDGLSAEMWDGLTQKLSAYTATTSQGMIEQLRKRKDPWEVAQIRAAAQIADQSLQAIMPLFQIGVSERDLAIELEYQMQKAGSEGLSFPTILGFGERSALPHGIPGQRRLQRGDLVVLDFGAVVNGYRSDMTRSFVAGTPNAQQQAMYDTVLQAQQQALLALRAGVRGSVVNAASEMVLHNSAFAQYAGPGLGHGLGIKLHERPFLSPFCEEVLELNYVVTIEPGIYLPHLGGVRIEDDVLITETGFEFLTAAPKEFALPL